MNVYNPLLDKRKNRKNKELNASENTLEASGPISPISGKNMVLASCNGIPVWLDADARLVLPVKKGYI